MHWWNRLNRIYPKLLVSFIIIVAPMYYLSLKMNEYGEKNVRKKTEHSISSRVNFYIRLLENDFTRYIAMQEEYVNDRTLRKLIYTEPIMSEVERYEVIDEIHNQLSRTVHTSPYIRGAGIYLPSTNKWISDSEAAIYADIPKEQYNAMKSIKDRFENPFVYWQNRLFLSFVYTKMVPVDHREPIFVVGVELDLPQLKRVLDSFTIGGSGGSMIIDPYGNWAISGDTSKVSWPEIKEAIGGIPPDTDEFLKEFRIGGETYWISAQKSRSLGITLLSYMPETEIIGSLSLYRVWYWVLSSLSLLLVALFAYWIYLQIHKPMRSLLRAFHKLEHGNWRVALAPKRQDEFGYLFIQFNTMVVKINELIQEVYEQQYRTNLSELRQLQSQINPHFLYNSFFILYRMAKDEENESIARFTSYLGRYFQFITRSHKNTVRLAEEVDFSRAYVEIQSFRFEERIAVRFEELPVAYADLEVPKLILQPLIENAYQHGLRDTIEGGLLEVRFEVCGDSLVIAVEDNGETISADNYDELSRKLQTTGWVDGETTGLVNVHRRMRLEFGDHGWVTFLRIPGGGNRVLLHIPINANTVSYVSDESARSEKATS
ncbi:two-component system sensor histidine kinase YesM [Paenibacillus rhizosphaerae]|uniref:Two-component system sensor histidine kinase YesM n=1 Tax=Paenibacillus rhizosphaerae TaxID=297318 RepID=A0A839TU57_9BACL|nr:histidine kinase [Paenibacillus rhizosphaerae]MBB3128227.1 two-component system sensor histidine kinase YesM [Paenibacillus rhizosphaerae]